jgi:hypothetical protein
VAGYPPHTEEQIKQFQKELDEIKFAVASNFVLDHIAQALIVALGASAAITALPALLILGIVQVAGALLIALVLEGVGKGYDSLFAPIIEEEMAHLKPILAQCGPAHFSKITFEGSFKQNDVQVSVFVCRTIQGSTSGLVNPVANRPDAITSGSLDAGKTFIQKIEGRGSSTWTKATSRDCSYKYEGNLKISGTAYIFIPPKKLVFV